MANQDSQQKVHPPNCKGKKQSPSLVNWWVFCSCWLASWGDFCSLYCATKWQLPGRSGAHAPTTRWGDVGTESGILRADQSNSVSPPEESQSTLLYLRNPQESLGSTLSLRQKHHSDPQIRAHGPTAGEWLHLGSVGKGLRRRSG